jgi:heme/copper-type cytochrome/quinol oxidase subunit 2
VHMISMTFRTSTAKTLVATIASLAMLAIFAAPSRADDDSSILKFDRGTVEPARLTLPANTPVKLQVINAGDAAVEFESFELHRERVVQPGQTITVNIPRLAPGTYEFVDDFSHGAVKGEIVSR